MVFFFVVFFYLFPPKRLTGLWEQRRKNDEQLGFRIGPFGSLRARDNKINRVQTLKCLGTTTE